MKLKIGCKIHLVLDENQIRIEDFNFTAELIYVYIYNDHKKLLLVRASFLVTVSIPEAVRDEYRIRLLYNTL